jgi:hypothetical protein
METGISFSVLVLGEIILVLVIALFFSIHHILKQKSLLKRLHEKYSEVKSAQTFAATEKASFYDEKKPANQNTIEEYLERSLADSLQRYEKNTGSKHPHLDPTHSFSGRTAALRCIYLTAEKEVFDERGITHAGWGLFERKLAEIIRWQDKKNTRRQEVRDHRSRLLQDQLAALKGSNEENKHLQEKINQLLKSEKKLKQYQLESQRTISNLQDMLEQLKQLSSAEKTPAPPPEAALGFFEMDNMDHLTDASAAKNSNARDMIRELKNYKSNFSAENKEKVDNYMNMLEVELMKSDQYIGNLKRELKEAKMQVTNYAIMLRDARHEQNSESLDIEDLSSVTTDTTNPVEQKNIINELMQLRKNNTIQRDLINKMNDEIQLLKHSVHPTDTDDIRKEKESEILRLERLVKECQGCIDTLESEVDHLYTQLQERSEASEMKAGDTSNKYDSEELTMITMELEKTIAHYQQLHAINRLILELMKCESQQSIAKLLLQFIKDFNAPIGFVIYSTLGKAEYFPSALFNESTIELVKSPVATNTLVHLDEGTLFILNKIHLIHLNTPSSSHPILETSLQGLVNAAEECIKNIELHRSSQKHSQETNSWVDSTKNSLSNIDIQYASQVEENRKTFNNFIAEIRRAYPLLNLHGQGAILLDNAINEYEERMHLLLSSGDVIDNEISKLIEHMEKLKNNTAN